MNAPRVLVIARQVALTIALASGVTVASVAAGALLIAPAVSKVADTDDGNSSFRAPALSIPNLAMPSLSIRELSLPTIPALTLTTLTSARTQRFVSRFGIPLVVTLVAVLALGRVPSVRQRFARTGRTRAVAYPMMATSARARMRTPARPDRTPRAVEALAASGTAPSEISWRTGLPVDAVAMLLALSTAQRQLQPPSA